MKCPRGEIGGMTAMTECLVEEEIELLYVVAMMCRDIIKNERREGGHC